MKNNLIYAEMVKESQNTSGGKYMGGGGGGGVCAFVGAVHLSFSVPASCKTFNYNNRFFTFCLFSLFYLIVSLLLFCFL
jgi:hypothetical protein